MEKADRLKPYFHRADFFKCGDFSLALINKCKEQYFTRHACFQLRT